MKAAGGARKLDTTGVNHITHTRLHHQRTGENARVAAPVRTVLYYSPMVTVTVSWGYLRVTLVFRW